MALVNFPIPIGCTKPKEFTRECVMHEKKRRRQKLRTFTLAHFARTCTCAGTYRTACIADEKPGLYLLSWQVTRQVTRKFVIDYGVSQLESDLF